MMAKISLVPSNYAETTMAKKIALCLQARVCGVEVEASEFQIDAWA